MIKCFRCGTSARQEPNGTIYRTCDCYASPLIMQPALGLGVGIDLLSAKPMIADRLPQPKSQPDDTPLDQARRLHTLLTNRIILHKADCSGCKALGRSCFEIVPTEELQEKWRQKAGMS